VFAFDRAAEHYRSALELAADKPPADLRALEIALGDALANGGRGRDAAAAYLRAAAGADETTAHGLERKASHQLLITGHFEQGLALLRRVTRELGVWLPRSRTVALLVALVRLLWASLFHRRLPALRSESELVQRELERLKLERELWQSLGFNDGVLALYFGMAAARRGWRLAEPSTLRLSVGITSFSAAAFGGVPSHRINEWLRMADELTVHGTDERRGYVMAAKSAVAFMTGEWRASYDHSHTATRLFANVEGADQWVRIQEGFATECTFQLGALRELAERTPTLVRQAEARGNLLALFPQAAGFGNIGWLVRDDSDGARQVLQSAEGRWPKRAFRMPDYWFLISASFYALYRAEALQAHAALVSRWATLRRAGILSIRHSRLQLWVLRSHLALASISETSDRRSRERLLRDARSSAKQVAAMRLRSSPAFADLVVASIEAVQGHPEAACVRFESAAAAFEALDMAAYAAAARYRLGELRGDATVLAAADAWFRSEGVVNVKRFVAILAPA
jgi:eukaryotic-like serine/threonine-protein kinase